MAHNFGNTTNFQVDSPDGFWAGLSAVQQANVTANANYLLGRVEAAFTTTTGWFGTDTSKFGTSNRQQVLFDTPDGKGASNNGYGTPIHVDTQSNNGTIGIAGPEVSMLWMAEWSEILMSLTKNWNSGDSSGEGLSQYCANQLFLAGHLDYYGQRFVGRLAERNWNNQSGNAVAERRPIGLAQHDIHRRHRQWRFRAWRRRSGQLRLRPVFPLLPYRAARIHHQPGDQQLLR